MGRRTESLLFRFGIIFLIFTVLTLLMSGLITFFQQSSIYKEQREESVQQLVSYLKDVIVEDGDDFLLYKNYIIEHRNEVKIPVDFTTEDVFSSREKYETLFAQQYPGKILGKDIQFDELSSEVQEAFVVYNHEYYLDLFEKARSAFNVIYTYFVIPTGHELDMYFMIDAVREGKKGDEKHLNLCDELSQTLERHFYMWEAWNSGEKSTGFDTYDNEFGKTYAYYAPLFINGEKVGVIAVDVEIADVNKAILNNSLRQIFYVGLVLVIAVALMLVVIYKSYIAKLSHLQKSVKAYSLDKNVAIARDIEKDANGKDEISVLALQVSSMILELENYMKSLLETAQALRDTKERADAMNELATKDALTGIRNKTAYDNEVRRIEWKMSSNEKLDFAIAMIDLNFLKRINDTFGHEQGNMAIKKLCYI